MLPGKTFTPADILQILRRRAWLIGIPPIVMLFAALVVSSRVPNQYQSDMLIAIDPQRVPDAFVRSTVTLATDLRLDAIEVQATSRTNLERMIQEMDLYQTERESLLMEDVVNLMRTNIEVELERGRPGPRGPEPPSAFHVRFTYPEPEMAAKVTHELGTLFVEQNTRDRRALGPSSRARIGGRIYRSSRRSESRKRYWLPAAPQGARRRRWSRHARRA